MRAHRRAQLAERMTAEPGWKDGDFVWCQPNGRPIGAHADWDEWKALLEAARIRADARPCRLLAPVVGVISARCTCACI